LIVSYFDISMLDINSCLLLVWLQCFASLLAIDDSIWPQTKPCCSNL